MNESLIVRPDFSSLPRHVRDGLETGEYVFGGTGEYLQGVIRERSSGRIVKWVNFILVSSDDVGLESPHNTRAFAEALIEGLAHLFSRLALPPAAPPQVALPERTEDLSWESPVVIPLEVYRRPRGHFEEFALPSGF
jgi:hypothetical protein